MLKKIIIPFIVALALSVVAAYYVYHWLTGYILNSAIKNFEVSWWQIIKFFLTWFIYFLALIILPFLSTQLITVFKFKKDNWRKIITVFEVGVLLFSWAATPPDFRSTIFVFLICQPIVIVNCIAIKQKLK